MADPPVDSEVIDIQEARRLRAGEVDPELARLPRPRRIGPILALSVLGLAAWLMITLRADLAYSLAPKAPRELASAAEATGVDNVYATVPGKIDVSAPGRLRGRQDTGHRLAPLQGTAWRVWIHVEGEAANVEPAYDDRHTGRVRKLRDLAFADDLDRYVAELPPQPRFVFPEALAAGLPDKDALGDPLAPAPEDKAAVDERVADMVVVTLVETAEIPDEASARRALADAGFGAANLTEQSAGGWSYEIMVPGADLKVVAARLRAARVYGASAAAKLHRFEGTVRDLRIDGGAVTLAGHTTPLASLERLVVFTRRPLPADATVVLEGETPHVLWYMPWLYGFLGIVAAFMLWALVRDRLPRRAQA